MPRATLAGSTKSIDVASGTTAGDALKKLGVNLQPIVGVKMNGAVRDIHWPITEDVALEPLTSKQPETIDVLRHSSSHLMAHAIQDLFPGVKFTIGPPIDTGFYYDVDLEQRITEEDLPKIEARMAELIQKDLPFARREVSKREAIDLMQKRGENFKVEIIEEIPSDKVSFYAVGQFDDLCEGPHLPSSGYVKAFKLLSVAGAYWRGDSRNKQLQRIYGTSFFSQEELDRFLKNLEEAAKRDHRRLGKDLDLFSFHEEAGAGFVYYHPHGAMIRHLIEERLRNEHLARGYEFVVTPHIVKRDLYDTSGHTSYYRENMYFMEIDEQEYAVKPMNCPGHITIFNRKLRSYRDLPKRYFELGTVYRYEKSGVLHGLLRVRGFTQDDAHIFCRRDQLQGEIGQVLDFVGDMMKLFGFEYTLSLSTRPEKFAGSIEVWDEAERALREALDSRKLPYDVDAGGGVFYGPKIDVKLKDAIGRLWQGPTIQVDFNLPERFQLSFIGEDGKKHQPVMIHRAILGSIERFLGALIEHTAGDFPLWLAPIQAVVIPITDRHAEAAEKVASQLRQAGIRVTVDARNEKMGYKIREAELKKIPTMLVLGDREIAEGKISVRVRHQGDRGKMTVEELTGILLAAAS